MRVLYSFPHPLGAPGIGTTAFHQVQGLIDHGVEVDLVCTSLARDVRGARTIVETLVTAGRRLPHRAIGVERAWAYHDRRAARILQRRAGEIDVVHTWPAGCVRTLRAARQLRVPGFREVPSAHTLAAFEDAAREAEAVGVELPEGHHHRFVESRLRRELEEFDVARFLLVPSAYVERSFLDRGVEQEKLVRHSYGFDPAAFAPAGPREARDGLVAVFVGRGEPNKGLHHALRAWVDSGVGDEGTFLVCGEILPAYAERLASLLAHPSVRRLGFVRDVASVLRDADVLVLPSVTEGSALVTYEAQASGCALLVSTAAGAPCEHGVQGLVHEPGDVEALTGHLRLVAADRGLLARLRAHAVENARGLTWAAAANRLAAAYDEALGADERVRTTELVTAE